jgi:membrane fusion protein (multidrug efflux system)
VHAGDLLIRLNDRGYRAALSKAVGALQESMIAQAQAEVVSAGAELARARQFFRQEFDK